MFKSEILEVQIIVSIFTKNGSVTVVHPTNVALQQNNVSKYNFLRPHTFSKKNLSVERFFFCESLDTRRDLNLMI